MVQRFAGDPYNHQDTTDEERNAHIAAIAANVGNEQIRQLLAALQEWWYPDIWPDIINLGVGGTPQGTFTMAYHFPGVFTLKVLELQANGATYPSLVDVTIARFSNLPFSLNPQAPRRGPYGFRIIGGTDVTFVNKDNANTANVYVEWEMRRINGR